MTWVPRATPRDGRPAGVDARQPRPARRHSRRARWSDRPPAAQAEVAERYRALHDAHAERQNLLWLIKRNEGP